MTLRRVVFCVGLGAQAFAGGITLVVLFVGGGRVSSIFLLAFTAGVAYGLVALEEYATAQQAVLAASRRNAEALAGMHETMLAKIKTATVDLVDLRDGEPDEPRRH